MMAGINSRTGRRTDTEKETCGAAGESAAFRAYAEKNEKR